MPMIFEVNNTAEDITRRDTRKRPCKENWWRQFVKDSKKLWSYSKDYEEGQGDISIRILMLAQASIKKWIKKYIIKESPLYLFHTSIQMDKNILSAKNWNVNVCKQAKLWNYIQAANYELKNTTFKELISYNTAIKSNKCMCSGITVSMTQ
jgi:hypothetical protein